MNQIQRKRLFRFARFLEKIPKENFDIENVAMSSKRFTDKCFTKKLRKHECGTAACAFGYLPIFNPKVFAYYNDWEDMQYSVAYHNKSSSTNIQSVCSEYFGLSRGYADWIFYYSGYDCKNITPKMVAKRILGILNKDKKTIEQFKYWAMC